MHIFSKNFSSDELRLIFVRYPCQELEYIFFKKLLAMHSTLYFRLKHANASRCILAITYPLASNASIFCSAPPLGCGSVHLLVLFI